MWLLDKAFVLLVFMNYKKKKKQRKIIKMQVSFTIDDKTIGRLDVIARDQNRSRSQLIKVLIKDYLMKYNYEKEQ